MSFSIIVAAAENGIIGKNGDMPWKKLPSDLKFFKTATSGHWCILGRKTYNALGNKVLPNRKFIIITRDSNFKSSDSLVVGSLLEALQHPELNNEGEVFIIGGGEIYNQAQPYCSKIYLTKIHETFEGDTSFTIDQPDDWVISEERKVLRSEKNPYDHTFVTYVRK